MKRILLPLLAALALPTAVNAEFYGRTKENFCEISPKAIKNPKVKNLWEKECKSDYEKSFKTQNNFLKKIFTSNNPEKTLNKKNAEDCLIGLYPCKKVNQDYLSSKLKSKVLNQLDLEKLRRKEKLERDRKSREWRSRYTRSQFTHKGITYTASKSCSDDKQFYWNVEKGFLKKEKVVEIGCLSDYELQSLKNQSSGGNRGAGRAASDRINNQTQRTINNMNQNYRNNFRNWQMKEFGY